MDLVAPPDLELWVIQYLADELADVPDLTVTNMIPDDYDGVTPMISVRDDGGSQYEGGMFERRLGVGICYGSYENPKPCRELAARVYALLTDPYLHAVLGSPVVRPVLEQCNGPYRITTQMRASREYIIVDYMVSGDIIKQ